MKRKKKEKKKRVSIAKLKKIAWHYFSIYIRLRDSDQRGFVRCYTCGRRLFWKTAQAGHFIAGRHNSVLFDERNVHAQCYACNIFLHGDVLNYLDHMLKDYGMEVVNELRRQDKVSKQFDASELEALIESLKTKIRNINTNAI